MGVEDLGWETKTEMGGTEYAQCERMEGGEEGKRRCLRSGQDPNQAVESLVVVLVNHCLKSETINVYPTLN